MEASTEITKQNKIMMSLVDKLCDHLPTQRIKLFIDNGFDEWETITYLKGEELVELGYTPEQCIIIMVAINSNCKEYNHQQVFDQQKINRVLQMAKVQQQKRMQIALNQQKHSKQKQNRQPHNQNQIQGIFQKQQIKIQIKQYPKKAITEQILMKSIASKLTKAQKQKPPLQVLSKITLIQLQNNQITDLQQVQLKKIHQVQNLYLAYNRIVKICGLQSLTKIKILKLQNNQITKIEGLQRLANLQQLTINDNLILRVQNLEANKRLHYLNVSNQRHKYNVELDQYSFDSLSYCLQKFQCNNNRVKDIDSLKHLAVVQEVLLKNNMLSEIGDLTVALNQMERLKKIDFRGNPLTKVPKYRDYIVILSKSLDQLDDKKILPKEREYLVKLYSLKHAKQEKEKTQGDVSHKNIGSKKQLDLHVTKMQQNDKIGRYMMNGGNNDLRGNAPFANTKVKKK